MPLVQWNGQPPPKRQTRVRSPRGVRSETEQTRSEKVEETCTDGELHDIHETSEDTRVCVVCGTEYDIEPTFEYAQT